MNTPQGDNINTILQSPEMVEYTRVTTELERLPSYIRKIKDDIDKSHADKSIDLISASRYVEGVLEALQNEWKKPNIREHIQNHSSTVVLPSEHTPNTLSFTIVERMLAEILGEIRWYQNPNKKWNYITSLVNPHGIAPLLQPVGGPRSIYTSGGIMEKGLELFLLECHNLRVLGQMLYSNPADPPIPKIPPLHPKKINEVVARSSGQVHGAITEIQNNPTDPAE